MKSTLWLSCPRTPPPNYAAAIDRTTIWNTEGGPHRRPLPPTTEGMTVLEIWPIGESAFDIVISLKDHIMLYPAYAKNNFVSRGHLDSTGSLGKVRFRFKLDRVPAAWKELSHPCAQNKLSEDFCRPLRTHSCLPGCGDFISWLSCEKGFCCFVCVCVFKFLFWKKFISALKLQ